MKLKAFAFCLFLLVVCKPLLAQQPPNDPIGENLFPPDLVLKFQREIGLTEEQKQFVRTEIRDTQGKFTDLQFQLQDEMEKMISALKKNRIDEQQTLAQLDKILSLEREIKRLQFTLIIRIKNRL